VKISRYLRRIIAGDKVVAASVLTQRNVIVWLFIALVALFLTHPVGEPRSNFDKRLPMPQGAAGQTSQGDSLGSRPSQFRRASFVPAPPGESSPASRSE
jgi:hypothetical protein